MADSLSAAQGRDNVVYLRLDEYIGGAILIGGLPYWGSGHGSAAIAHLIVEPNGSVCRCGSRGCLDTVASGDALVRRSREIIKAGRHSSLEERTEHDLSRISANVLVEEARTNDPVALAVLDELVEWLSLALANCVNLLGPDMVVIGGSLGRAAGDVLLEPLRRAVRRRTLSASMRHVEVVISTLGDEATACGAAVSALLANVTHSIRLHTP